jgi:hypothetical protein
MMAVVQMSEQQMADGADEGEDDPPAYRVSHLMDDLADAFADRIQLVAPLGKGGVKPRVHNRVTFTVSGERDDREYVEDTLDRNGFAWTLGETTEDGTEYVVLGRAIRDLRELRKGDRIHLNGRGGPFKVYRVLEQETGPEVLQKSSPSVTVEVTNVDTGTDWMVVQWDGEPHPWAYVYTEDKHASGGFRYRKVEQVERDGRVGPRRLFAPPADDTGEVERAIPDQLETARGHGLTESGVIHATDMNRVETLFSKPIPDLYSPEDAALIREFLQDMGEWWEREANALEVETDEDKERAAEHQEAATRCSILADAFSLLEMDAVDVTEDADVYEHEPCGRVFTDRFKYSKHCGLCDAGSDEPGEDGEDGADEGQADGNTFGEDT